MNEKKKEGMKEEKNEGNKAKQNKLQVEEKTRKTKRGKMQK